VLQSSASFFSKELFSLTRVMLKEHTKIAITLYPTKSPVTDVTGLFVG
jgi:hypothetical protein